MIVLELAVIAFVFWADAHKLVPVSKTPFLFLLGWASLRLRGLRWRSVGMFIWGSWRATVIVGVLGGIAIELLELFVTQPLLTRLFHQGPDLSLFHALHGNWKLLGLALALTWTLAAFGEEMVWRGYITNRVADVLGRTRWAWTAALVLVSIAFGFAHEYQGAVGVIENALDGLPLALLYVRFGNSLAVPIIAHGVTDTVDTVLLFLGKYPGV